MKLQLQALASSRAWRAIVLAGALAAGMATGLRSESSAAATTGRDGAVEIAGLVPGDYELRAWHPDQRIEPTPRRITVGAQDRLAHRFVAALTPRWQTPSGE